MRIIGYLLFVLLIKIASYGKAQKDHLHLRIYVPDVVNRLVHTKTVYVHLHRPALKKPKPKQKHIHYENWSSWSNYGHHHGYKDHHGKHELADELEERDPNEHKDSRGRQPVYGHHKDFPQPFEDNRLEQNSGDRDQDRPRYAVHENVNDIPPNAIEAFSYEEGYRKGLHSESGHLRSGQSSKFLDDQHEEQDEAENDGFKEDFEGKTDAGRYLVDDVEYENTRDKRNGVRYRRRIRKS